MNTEHGILQSDANVAGAAPEGRKLPQSLFTSVRNNWAFGWKFRHTTLSGIFGACVAEFIGGTKGYARFVSHVGIVSITAACQSSSNITVGYQSLFIASEIEVIRSAYT
jgi:hypothetical protein